MLVQYPDCTSSFLAKLNRPLRTCVRKWLAFKTRSSNCDLRGRGCRRPAGLRRIISRGALCRAQWAGPAGGKPNLPGGAEVAAAQHGQSAVGPGRASPHGLHRPPHLHSVRCQLTSQPPALQTPFDQPHARIGESNLSQGASRDPPPPVNTCLFSDALWHCRLMLKASVKMRAVVKTPRSLVTLYALQSSYLQRLKAMQSVHAGVWAAVPQSAERLWDVGESWGCQ